MLTQLIYTSRARAATDSDAHRDDVEAILAAAHRHNPTVGITGCLLIGPGWYAQVLEGESQPVSQLFRAILGDPRHERVRLIGTRFVRERGFSEWSMASTRVAPSRFDLSPLDAVDPELAMERILAVAQEAIAAE